MFIFIRRRTINPSKHTQALDFAIESAAHVSKVIGKPITVSRLAFGQPAGVVQFTYTVENMSELDESASGSRATPAQPSSPDERPSFSSACPKTTSVASSPPPLPTRRP